MKDNFNVNIDKFIVPEKNIFKNIESSKIVISNSNKLSEAKIIYMSIGTPNKNALQNRKPISNRNYISNKKLKNIIDSNNFKIEDTKIIFDRIISLGNDLYKNIENYENKCKEIIKGTNHFEELLTKYGDKIVDSNIEKKLEDFFNTYNYIPFGEKKLNYLKFITFVIQVWEITYICNDIKVETKLSEKYKNKYFYNSYNLDILIDLTDSFLDKYKKYGKIEYNLINSDYAKKAEINLVDNEIFSTIICTEELIIPVILELKFRLCSIISGDFYKQCDICHSLFLGSLNKKYCSDSCYLEHERRRKAKAKANKS